jgi:hypothetical protein
MPLKQAVLGAAGKLNIFNRIGIETEKIGALE